ncbi:MAG: iron ABC transporter permease [Lachnospiraceae bacterium]|nr:iron ABC transporter permease [Lachnospiraceae bacterium]
MLCSLSHNHMQRLLLWQMGSFSGRKYKHVLVILIVSFIGIVMILRHCRELDLLTFGDEDAMALGVDTKSMKIKLLVFASLLTGISVCFTGVIGFVDLAVPHVVRRVFGSSHKLVIPMTLVIGGTFLSLADLLARTLLAPQEIPVGAVTAFFGAPFFLFVYFKERE